MTRGSGEESSEQRPGSAAIPTPTPSSSPSHPSPGLRSQNSAAAGEAAQRTGGGRAAEDGDARLYLHPATLSRLASLELRAKMIVEGVLSGQHRSPYQGFSTEFSQHRQYVAGDDLRHLDWKVYGRSDKLYVKQFRQETNFDLIVMVDSSGSMSYGTRAFADASGMGQGAAPTGRGVWTKFDHATAVAAAMSFLALKQGDRAGLVVFADEVRRVVKPASAQGQWRQIVGALGVHPVERATNLRRAVDQTIASFPHRALVVVVSDFLEEPAVVRESLARLRHRGHDVILCRVIDAAERDFDFKDEAPFEGLEGEGRVQIDPRSIRDAYLACLREHIEGVERAARDAGFDALLTATDQWLGPAMAAFVARREARMKRIKLG